jgi:hypothetical protein
MTSYKTTVVAIAVHRDNESPIYGEGTTTVRLDDEGSGPFLVLSQGTDEGTQTLRMDQSEIRIVMEAAERLIEKAE